MHPIFPMRSFLYNYTLFPPLFNGLSVTIIPSSELLSYLCWTVPLSKYNNEGRRLALISHKEMEALLEEEYEVSPDDVKFYDLLDISIFVIPWLDKKETKTSDE